MVPKFLVLDTEPFAVLGADGNAGECTHAVFAVAFWERGRINFRDLPLEVRWLMLETEPILTRIMPIRESCAHNGLEVRIRSVLDGFGLSNHPFE